MTRHAPRLPAMFLCLALAAPLPMESEAASLPAQGPLPQARPSLEKPAPPSANVENDMESRGSADGVEGVEKQDLPTAGEAPLPAPRPKEDAEIVADPYHRDIAPASRDRRSSIGRHNWKSVAAADEAREADRACQARLQNLGVTFETREALSDPQGCSVPYPLEVNSLGSGIKLEPAAVMNCRMTEALANFAKTTIMPAARATYGSDLAEIANASAYVCRPRNGTSKLSEHAFGNAFDMARFVLKNGTALDVAATGDAKALKFLGDIRKAACGPFKTVLGPGSDGDHANHLHVDLAPRRNGATFCQ
jgi:hypothetical protein